MMARGTVEVPLHVGEWIAEVREHLGEAEAKAALAAWERSLEGELWGLRLAWRGLVREVKRTLGIA